MNFQDIIRFRDAEDGAVTVDWVVLTAALVGIGLAVILALQPGLNSAAGRIETTLQTDNTIVITPTTP